MPSDEYALANPPSDERSKELWLQHSAGFIFFEDARQYAIDMIDEATDPETKQKIVEGINNSLYGIMMILDGVSGQLENPKYSVTLETKINLTRKSDDIIETQLDIFDGDGMCMGFHGWLEDDYGEDEVIIKKGS